MTVLKATKNKHLNMDERREIQECMDHGMTFKEPLINGLFK